MENLPNGVIVANLVSWGEEERVDALVRHNLPTPLD
jgi:hypothetical protein